MKRPSHLRNASPACHDGATHEQQPCLHHVALFPSSLPHKDMLPVGTWGTCPLFQQSTALANEPWKRETLGIEPSMHIPPSATSLATSAFSQAHTMGGADPSGPESRDQMLGYAPPSLQRRLRAQRGPTEREEAGLPIHAKSPTSHPS